MTGFEDGKDKQDFLRRVTVFCDTREKDCGHVEEGLKRLGARIEQRKLNIGDYSFAAQLPGGPVDFSASIAVERKSGVEELYSNIMEKPVKGNVSRFEKELDAAHRQLNQFVLLIEEVGGMEEIKAYVTPEWRMKMSPKRIQDETGKLCYFRLRAWQAANRYNLRVECVADKANTARVLVETFYYYYRNYRALIAPRRL